MDLLQIAPIGCLVTGLQVNAFGSLLAIMAINVTVIGVSVAIYEVRKVMISLNRNLQNDTKLRKNLRNKRARVQEFVLLLVRDLPQYVCPDSQGTSNSLPETLP